MKIIESREFLDGDYVEAIAKKGAPRQLHNGRFVHNKRAQKISGVLVNPELGGNYIQTKFARYYFDSDLLVMNAKFV
jgi:hypothetical protein